MKYSKKLIGIFLYLFTIVSSYAYSDSTYYYRLLEEINHNLDEENYAENYDLYDQITKSDTFLQIDCYLQGQLVNKVGVTYYLDYKEYQAIALFRQILETIWDDCESVSAVEYANTLYNIGVSYQYTPEIHLGSSYIDRALLMLENQQLDTLELATKYHGAGSYYSEIKDQEKAETYFNNALNLYKTLPDEALSIFDVYNELIILNLEFEEFVDLSKYLNAAVRLQKEYPTLIPEADLAFVYLNGAIGEVELNHLDPALNYAELALKLINQDDQKQLYSNALEIKASVYQKKGNYRLAQQYFEQVLQIRIHSQELISDRLSKAIAYENLSELFWELDSITQALEFVNLALEQLFIGYTFDQNRNPSFMIIRLIIR